MADERTVSEILRGIMRGDPTPLPSAHLALPDVDDVDEQFLDNDGGGRVIGVRQHDFSRPCPHPADFLQSVFNSTTKEQLAACLYGNPVITQQWASDKNFDFHNLVLIHFKARKMYSDTATVDDQESPQPSSDWEKKEMNELILDLVIFYMNYYFAFINDGSYFIQKVIVEGKIDYTQKNMKQMCDHHTRKLWLLNEVRKVQVPNTQKSMPEYREEKVGELFKLRRPLSGTFYENTVFIPISPVYLFPDAPIVKPKMMNLWRGFTLRYDPSDVTDIPYILSSDPFGLSFVLEHMWAVWCGKDDDVFRYVLLWFANLIHRPFAGCNFVMCLQGMQGIGKSSVFLELLTAVIGKEYVLISDGPRFLRESFNDDMICKLVILMEEMNWGTLSSNLLAQLKNLITSKDMRFRTKFGRNEQRKVCYSIVASTNCEQAGPNEAGRRWFLLKSKHENVLAMTDHQGNPLTPDAFAKEKKLHGNLLLEHLRNPYVQRLFATMLYKVPYDAIIEFADGHAAANLSTEDTGTQNAIGTLKDKNYRFLQYMLYCGINNPDNHTWDKIVPWSIVEEYFCVWIGKARGVTQDIGAGNNLQQLRDVLISHLPKLNGKVIFATNTGVVKVHFGTLEQARATYDMQYGAGAHGISPATFHKNSTSVLNVVTNLLNYRNEAKGMVPLHTEDDIILVDVKDDKAVPDGDLFVRPRGSKGQFVPTVRTFPLTLTLEYKVVKKRKRDECGKCGGDTTKYYLDTLGNKYCFDCTVEEDDSEFICINCKGSFRWEERNERDYYDARDNTCRCINCDIPMFHDDFNSLNANE